MDKTYKTTDFDLVTTLTYFGNLVKGIEVNPKDKRATFYIKQDENLQNTIEAYFKKEIRVEPQGYRQSYRYVKNLLNDSIRDIYKEEKYEERTGD